MPDLNDLFYFVQVVAHGGFAPAGRALRIPKSRLSRRVADLEARLGVRLIERSSRRFRVTEIGEACYEQSRLAVAAAERAEAVVAARLTEPRGVVRFACPTGLVELVSPMIPPFLKRHPQVNVQIIATDRAVDLINERIDLALRVRVTLDADATLTMRMLGKSRRILVASPAIANGLATGDIAALGTVPTLATSDDVGDVVWSLEGPDGALREQRLSPRFSCVDFAAVRDAAVAGLGVALLPDHACAAALRNGALTRVFPDWRGREGRVHLVFTTRTGLPPQVRAWIDHLAADFPEAALGG